MKFPEFIDFVAAEADMPKTTAKVAIEAAIKGIFESLKGGEDLAIPGFGTFTVRDRAARTGRNPQTGAEIQIDARKVAGFKPAKALKDELKNL